jgi:ATP-dependent Lon protease
VSAVVRAEVGDAGALREHEFTIQLRALDAAKSGAQTSVALLVALSSALLGRSVKGGTIIAGHLTLGGSLEPIHTAIDLVERAFERGAETILLPVSCRRALADLSDELATRVQVLFYADSADVLRKALVV